MAMSFEKTLLTLFFDYLEAVVKLKENVLDGSIANSLPLGGERREVTIEADDIANAVSHMLARKIQKMEDSISRKYGALEMEIFLKVKYVLAAITDEIFIFQFELSNKKKLPWVDYLLEDTLFGSRSAGNTLFADIERLLEDTSGEVVLNELAKMYLLTLRMGFLGRYRAKDDSAPLEDYKTKLVNFIGDDAVLGKSLIGVSSNDLVERETKRNRLISLRPWFRLSLVVICIYLVVSSTVWITSLKALNTAMSGVQ